MPNIHWRAFCSADRNEGIFEIEKIIARHAFITGHQMFSDLGLSIRIEIEERKIHKLYSDLEKFMTIDGLKNPEPDSGLERIIFLNVTFTKGRGSLEIEIPSVPG